MTVGSPSHMASNAKNVSMSWRQNDVNSYTPPYKFRTSSEMEASSSLTERLSSLHALKVLIGYVLQQAYVVYEKSQPS